MLCPVTQIIFIISFVVNKVNNTIHTFPIVMLNLYSVRSQDCLDHDDAGRKAVGELKGFFEAYNQNLLKNQKYDYCHHL